MSRTRQLAAIMFTDMVGYTALMQADEALAIAKRERHKLVLESAIRKFNGRILQYYGDGTLSIFSSSTDCVRCAMVIQRSLLESPKVELRIGIHTGDILLEEEGVYGDGVNVASRVESLSVPGGIFLSGKVYDDIKNQADIQAREVGIFELKNVKEPVHVFAISNPGFPVPTRSEIKGKLNDPANRLAVLPFANFSGDPENEYFSDGITEELINALTKVDGLLVTSRTSSFAFKNRHEDIREIASKLNVNKILEGSVRRAGNRVRITAQLINSSDGYHLWSETFDRDLHDIFAVQDEIARIIVNKLRASLYNKPGPKQLVKQSTSNLEAYSLYLKGNFHLAKLIPSDVQKALSYFEKAVQLDPEFPLPYVGVASCYARLGSIGLIDPHKAFEIVHQYAERALRLDPALGDAYIAKGAAYLLYDWKWKEAREALIKGLELNPGSSLGCFMMSLYHLYTGKLSESVRVLEKALLHDPLSLFLLDALCEKYFLSRRYDEAIALADRILEIDPRMRHALETKGFSIGMKGNWQQALAIFEEVHRLTNHPLRGLSPLAYAYAITGNREKAMDCLLKIQRRQQEDAPAILDADLAFIWWALGDTDKCFHYLFKALDQRIAITPYILYSPLHEGLQKDSRVEELKRRMNLLGI